MAQQQITLGMYNPSTGEELGLQKSETDRLLDRVLDPEYSHTSDEYMQCTHRTAPDQSVVYRRLIADGPAALIDKLELLHGLLGVMTELGELASLFKRHLYYGEELDKIEIGKESGDLNYYVARICASSQVKLSQIQKAQLAKCLVRWPVYDNKDVPRDLLAEHQATLRYLEGIKTFKDPDDAVCIDFPEVSSSQYVQALESEQEE